MTVLRVLLATLASAAAAEALELHVSAHPTAPAGDGTRLRPFATLHEARDAMRAGLGAHEPRTVSVEGDHHLAEPLLLDERDSGTATAPVTWASLVSRPILTVISHRASPRGTEHPGPSDASSPHGRGEAAGEWLLACHGALRGERGGEDQPVRPRAQQQRHPGHDLPLPLRW